MNTPITLSLVAAVAVAVSGCGKKDTVAPVQKTSFSEVTSQLDSGGNVYGYLSTDQWLNGLSTNIAQWSDMFASLPNISDSDQQGIRRAGDVIAHVIQTSGVENLNAIGVSGIEVAPGLHRTKMIFHHGKGRGQGLLWNVAGKQAHELTGLNLLTTNAAFASYGDLDIPLLWQFVDAELQRIPEMTQALKNWPAEFEKNTQMSWSGLLESLGGEAGFVLTLDPSRKIVIPAGEPLEMPEPGLLLIAKVNNDLLYDRLSAELKKNGQAQVTEEPGLKMCAMQVPVPLPIDLTITVASSGGHLFVATSPALVRRTLAVRDGKEPGLRQSEAFAKLQEFLPKQGNSFSYVAPIFTETIQNVQKEFMSRAPEAEQLAGLQKLLFDRPAVYGLSIGVRTETGWQTVSVGNQDSATALIAAPAVAGTAIGAAMILPALAKAKAKAQSIQCVNNLKQIGLAFRIWAIDNEDQFPFHIGADRGGTMGITADLAYRHFQVLSNELNTPKILVCPSDEGRHPAMHFSDLDSENVTYQIRTGKEVTDANPEEVLATCPIHGHVLRVDGSVQVGRRPFE